MRTLKALIVSGFLLIILLLWFGLSKDTNYLMAENPHYAIIMLHGYGTNVNDMINLAQDLKDKLPISLQSQISFFAPEGSSSLDSGQYSWYKSPSEADFTKISEYLQKYVDKNIKNKGYQKVILLGFSQGASVATNTSSKLDIPIAGVIGFSGEAYDSDEVFNRDIPFLLIQGNSDRLVPEFMASDFSKELDMKGIKSQAVSIQGMSHEINGQALNEAVKFIEEKFK